MTPGFKYVRLVRAKGGRLCGEFSFCAGSSFIYTLSCRCVGTVPSLLYLNRAELIGRVGKDPVVRERSCHFSVATSFSFKDKEGKFVDRPNWTNVVVWVPHLIKICAEHLVKGTGVFVAGRLETTSYENKNDGNRRVYTTSIVAEQIIISSFGGRAARGDLAGSTPPASSYEKLMDKKTELANHGVAGAERQYDPDDGDDIPF